MAQDRTGAQALSSPALLDRESIRSRLSTLLEEVCRLSPEAIHDRATIDRDFEMESVQMVELQVAIEQDFDVTIDFLEVLRRNSFRRITDYIYELYVERASAS